MQIKFLIFLLTAVSVVQSKSWFFKFLEKFQEHYVYEGDMLLNEEEITSIITKGVARPGSTGDGIQTDENGITTGMSTAKKKYRWPGGIVYYKNKLKCPLESLFGTALCFVKGKTKNIKKAIEAWEKHTCVRFKDLDKLDDNTRRRQRDYVEFFDGGPGQCYSNVGRVGGRQGLSIGSDCGKPGIIMHEIGHALGFFHEQSRPDRDTYIKINWGNILEQYKMNFRKYKESEVSDMDTPYDYGSIMHYPDNAFVKKYGQKSIQVKRSSVKIGQRDYLSKWDIEEMRRYYEC